MSDTQNPIDTRELRMQRADKIDEARRLLDKPRMTAAEREEVNRLTEEARTLANEIQRAELENDDLRDGAFRTSGSGNTLRFRDATSGREIRAARHNESFRSTIGVAEPQESVGKILRGMATGRWDNAEREQRAYSQAASAGGYLFGPEQASFIIDLARTKSVLSAAGATTVPMNSEELQIAVITSDPTASWTPEGGTISETEGAFGRVTARAKCIAVLCRVSRELLMNASNSESVIVDSMTSAIALGFDSAGLNGTGASNAPMGLLYSPQTATYDVSGNISHDKLLLASRALWRLNREPQSLIIDANVRADISMLKNGDGNYQPLPADLASLNRLVSTQIESTSGSTSYNAYLGDFSNTLLCVRNQVEVQASEAADDAFQKKQVLFRALLWCDVVHARANDVCRLCGITLATT